MCGIHASISTRGIQNPSEELKHLLCCRGPDYTGQSYVEVTPQNGISYWISAMSTVLALRGNHVTVQPFIDPSNGSVLCWNGEAWKIGSNSIEGNDGQLLFDLLMRASSTQKCAAESIVAILNILQTISGPFAFVFVDKIHSQIYFGRDCLGRRSLLCKIDGDSHSLHLSSVADPTSGPWLEVEADAIYQLSCEGGVGWKPGSSTDGLLSTPFASISKHLWDNPTSDSSVRSPFLLSNLSGSWTVLFWQLEADKTFKGLALGIFNIAHPAENQSLDCHTESVQLLRRHLCESLRLRILNIPLPPGSDTGHHVRVAVLFSGGLDCTVLARLAHDILPLDHQIDLINVAFENPRVVKAASNPAKPSNGGNKVAKNGNGYANYQVSAVQDECSSEYSPFESCPDRETGRKAFRELQNICPGRCWRFVAVNVPYSETMAHRTTVVKLIHPHNTEMDLSIAFALYFAARGTGVASTNSEMTPIAYNTPARVLLSGLGADELFGGYTRHATAFNRRGFTGLLEELKLDVERLGKRNLGRDDRVISHWGREARFPYLDETVVKWAVECPIWEKCGFRSNVSGEREVPELEPGKKVLRLLAYELRMHSAAQEKKRAIQFGARTAKMEIGRTKGTAVIS